LDRGGDKNNVKTLKPKREKFFKNDCEPKQCCLLEERRAQLSSR
jgi:hypothetical protein